MILNMTTSAWAEVGDFLIRSDGTTVQPITLDNGNIAWTVQNSTSETLTHLSSGRCMAYTSAESAMLVADSF